MNHSDKNILVDNSFFYQDDMEKRLQATTKQTKTTYFSVERTTIALRSVEEKDWRGCFLLPHETFEDDPTK